MAHIDESFPLLGHFNPLLEGNRNGPLRNPPAEAAPPRQLVLEPRLAEDVVRLADQAPAPERPPAERPVEDLPTAGPLTVELSTPGLQTEEGLPTESPDQDNPDILGVLNAESLDIGVPRSFVANFQADLRDTLALAVLEGPRALEPEIVAVPTDINPAGPPPPVPETEVAERGQNVDLLI